MIAPLSSVSLADIELQLLLEAVYRYTGYDFREYAPATLKRRVSERLRAEGVTSVSALQDRVLHDLSAMERFVYGMSVNATSLFRDPAFFVALRERVVPMLRTFPYVRIWCAGAATGEEAYSLAILMQEEGLLRRCKIYATDASDKVVEEAKRAAITLDALDEARERYREAGGRGELADHFTVVDGEAFVGEDLRENLIFAQHNLATDGCFNEFHLVNSRGTLGHFTKTLSYQAHQTFFESLVRLGYVALGERESLRYTPHERCFEPLVEEQHIYRRVR